MRVDTIKRIKKALADSEANIRDWEKKVRKSNAKFHRASPEEKRVILAKDVIAALDGRRLYAVMGRYYPSPGHRVEVAMRDLGIAENGPDGIPESTAVGALMKSKVVTRIPIGCLVCAKGALFTAKVDRLNGVTIREEVETGIDPSALLEKSGIFSLEQLYLIEAAFERDVGLYQNFVYRRKDERIEAWYRKHPRSKREAPEFDLYEPGEEDLMCTAKKFGDRVYSLALAQPSYSTARAIEMVLRTIMQNIIDNNGTFDPNVPTPIPERKAKQL